MEANSQASVLVRPDREAASTLPALEDLFRAVAREVRTRIVNRAGADVPVRLGMARVTTVGGIIEDTDARDGGVFGLFRFNPMGLPGLFVIQGKLLNRLVGVLLGEKPDAEQPPYRVRPVTPTELRLCRRIAEDVLDSLSASWPEESRPSLDIEHIGASPRLAQSFTSTTPVVAASLDFGAPDMPFGLMTLGIPAQAVRDLKVRKVQSITRELRQERYDMDRVMPLSLTAVAQLARMQVNVRSLEDLKVGDEIELGRQSPVQVRINGQTLYLGEAGSASGRHSVRIIRRMSASGKNSR